MFKTCLLLSGLLGIGLGDTCYFQALDDLGSPHERDRAHPGEGTLLS